MQQTTQFEAVPVSLLTSTPFIIISAIVTVIAFMKALPMIADFFRSHFAPYRSSIPGIARAALFYDLMMLAVIVVTALTIFYKNS